MVDVIFWNAVPLNFFLNSNTRYIGPYKLGHWIRKHGYQSQVIDFIDQFKEEELYTATKKFLSDTSLVLAISTTFLCHNDSKDANGVRTPFPDHVTNVARRLKEEFPKLKVVIGGYSSDHLYMQGIADVIIQSYKTPVEDIFLEYIEHLKNGTPLPLGRLQSKFYDVPISGSYFKMLYDTARYPKYNIEVDDFRFTKQDIILNGEALPLDISRGCIFACKFCQHPNLGKKKMDYVRGMDYIRNELIYNWETFGTTRYMILDDTFNDTESKMQSFYDMTQTLPFKITYTAYLRADLIDRFPDTAHMLKESGLWGAFHGLESLHPHASNIIGKAWSGRHAKDFIPKLYHDLWKGEIPQQLSFIVGLPKETREDLNNTVKWFQENNLWSLVFYSLGLIGINERESKITLLSEFDRNADKYGFTFDKDLVWINETWNSQTAFQNTIELEKQISSGLKKSNVWTLGNMEFLGYDKEFLFNTPIHEIDRLDIRKRNGQKFREYYRKLLNSG